VRFAPACRQTGNEECDYLLFLFYAFRNPHSALRSNKSSVGYRASSIEKILPAVSGLQFEVQKDALRKEAKVKKSKASLV